MSRYMIPAGVEVLDTWSEAGSKLNRDFYQTDKVTIFEDDDINSAESSSATSRHGEAVVVFNVPSPNRRALKSFAVKVSQVVFLGTSE